MWVHVQVGQWAEGRACLSTCMLGAKRSICSVSLLSLKGSRPALRCPAVLLGGRCVEALQLGARVSNLQQPPGCRCPSSLPSKCCHSNAVQTGHPASLDSMCIWLSCTVLPLLCACMHARMRTGKSSHKHTRTSVHTRMHV